MSDDLRCIRCGAVVRHAGPPIPGKDGARSGFFDDTAKPAQLDERYSTGYCTRENRKVETVRASSEEEAVEMGRRPRRKAPEAVPPDMWPLGTSFAVRER